MTGSANSVPGRHEPLKSEARERLADLPLSVEVSLDTRPIRVRELLGLETGTLLPCEQRVREPFKVTVNGVTVARGEILVAEGRLALRLVETCGGEEP